MVKTSHPRDSLQRKRGSAPLFTEEHIFSYCTLQKFLTDRSQNIQKQSDIVQQTATHRLLWYCCMQLRRVKYRVQYSCYILIVVNQTDWIRQVRRSWIIYRPTLLYSRSVCVYMCVWASAAANPSFVCVCNIRHAGKQCVFVDRQQPGSWPIPQTGGGGSLMNVTTGEGPQERWEGGEAIFDRFQRNLYSNIHVSFASWMIVFRFVYLSVCSCDSESHLVGLFTGPLMHHYLITCFCHQIDSLI